MTIRYIVKCDLCGKEHEIGWGRSLTETPGQFEKPDGWQMLTYASYQNPASGIALKMDIMICPRCDNALAHGKTVVSAYLDDKFTAKPNPIVISTLEPEVIPLSDKTPEISEEEANL